MRYLVSALVLVGVSACSGLTDVDGHFAAYNLSPADPIVAIVNADEAGGTIAPNGHASFKATVQVPYDPTANTQPTQVQAEVSLSFKNLRTGVQTVPIQCQAGAKWVTSITYYPPQYDGGNAYAQCSVSY